MAETLRRSASCSVTNRDKVIYADKLADGFSVVQLGGGWKLEIRNPDNLMPDDTAVGLRVCRKKNDSSVSWRAQLGQDTQFNFNHESFGFFGLIVISNWLAE